MAACPRCQQLATLDSAQGYCALHHALWQLERARAVAWARWVLASPHVRILDTETTGLDGTAEVVELSVVSAQGTILFDSLIRPQAPIPAAATAIHSLDDRAVAHAPTLAQVYERLVALLAGQIVVVYNAAFDRRVLQQSGARWRLPALRPVAWHCAMQEYARFSGAWNAEKGAYRWHKLEGGDHTALGDCWATWALIRAMAEEG